MSLLKREYWLMLAAVALVGGILWIAEPVPTKAPEKPVFARSADPANTTYNVQGLFTLANGAYAGPFVGQGAQGQNLRPVNLNAKLFEASNPGDLNGDGVNDYGVILVLDYGGSGTFYYVSAALSDSQNPHGTNGILLGDRIAPQNIRITNGVIEVNYADRGPKDSYVIKPYIGKTLRARVVNGGLEE